MNSNKEAGEERREGKTESMETGIICGGKDRQEVSMRQDKPI